MSPSSLEALRTTWQHLSTRNNWVLVKDEESFLRHATEELHNLQDIRSPEQRMRMALTRAYSALLYKQLWERSERAAYEVWLASYHYALRDRFPKEEAEVLAQEAVTTALEKLHTLKSPESLIFWMQRVYWTVRSSATKKRVFEQPLFMPDEEGMHDLPDPKDQFAVVEQVLSLQYLARVIGTRLKNETELKVFIRYILRKESALVVAADLRLNPAHVRLVKSRLLKRLREDQEFMRFLQELAGDPNLPGSEGGSDECQPRA